MTHWTETYRGIVSPWECDMTEHFTIAYYFDRLADATALFGRALGLAELARGESRPGRLDVRFVRELRAGASFHILSGPLRADGEGLSLAHRVVDSASGETVTWVEEVPSLAALAPQLRERIAGQLVAWEGRPNEPRPEPKTFDGFRTTARDRVKTGEIDEGGGLTRAGFVHRFTAALVQALAGFGFTAEYMAERRRAYSTFELKLSIARVPRLGDPLLVESGLLHLGGSSMRFLHRMSDAESGEERARLSQFGVQLDLDSRRPAPIPEEFRAKAAQLLTPVKG